MKTDPLSFRQVRGGPGGRLVCGTGCGSDGDAMEHRTRSLSARKGTETLAVEFKTQNLPLCARELEIHSLFRFAFLSLQRKRLAQKSGLLARLFEAFLEGEDDEPAFPPLPSSLLPRL